MVSLWCGPVVGRVNLVTPKVLPLLEVALNSSFPRVTTRACRVLADMIRDGTCSLYVSLSLSLVIFRTAEPAVG